MTLTETTDGLPVTGDPQLEDWLDGHDISIVRVEGMALDPLSLGKQLHRSKFTGSLPRGPAVTEFVFGYDLGGTPSLGFWGDWRPSNLGDVHLRPDPTTIAPVPERPGWASCMADFTDTSGRPLPLCGRTLVRDLAGRLADRGYSSRFAFELEGQLFEESFTEARRRNWQGLTPVGVQAPVAYLHQNHHRMAPFFEVVCRRLDEMGIAWEAWNDEAAPGQFELNLAPVDPVTAADRLVRTREVLKEVAHEQGRSVTFMPRVTEEYGNGLHVHHSLADLDTGEPVFFDPRADGNRSRILDHWIGGLMATMAGAVSLLSPTINSYRRLQGFLAAPTHLTWAGDNKSTALRVLTASPGATRVEHRVAGGDAHPYYMIAAVLAGGLAGLEHSLEPPPAHEGLAWGLPDRFEALPVSITTAADALAADALLREQLGSEVIDYWIGSRRFEWLMFHTTGGDAEATAPTPWEMSRYFELL
ncbi:MAG TPA: glutamine synthetase [Acidimicrobiales bacterium]|nr:glutamine synthetase [Acidimicrobiales bacterium]